MLLIAGVRAFRDAALLGVDMSREKLLEFRVARWYAIVLSIVDDFCGRLREFVGRSQRQPPCCS